MNRNSVHKNDIKKSVLTAVIVITVLAMYKKAQPESQRKKTENIWSESITISGVTKPLNTLTMVNAS